MNDWLTLSFTYQLLLVVRALHLLHHRRPRLERPEAAPSSTLAA